MASLPTVTQITGQGSGNIEIDSWSLRRRCFDAIASKFAENHQTRFREDRRLILGLQELPRLSHRRQMYGSDLRALDFRDVVVMVATPVTTAISDDEEEIGFFQNSDGHQD